MTYTIEIDEDQRTIIEAHLRRGLALTNEQRLELVLPAAFEETAELADMFAALPEEDRKMRAENGGKAPIHGFCY